MAAETTISPTDPQLLDERKPIDEPDKAGSMEPTPLRPRRDIEIRLSLEEAVRIALKRNIDIRVAEVDVSIGLHELVSQQAVFDPHFTMGANYAKNREPSASFLDLGEGGLLPAVQINPYEFSQYQAGVGGLTPLGTSYSISLRQSEYDRAITRLYGFNPQERASAGVRVTQPLLRGAWYPYNTAGVRVARNNRLISVYALEKTAMDIIFEVEQAYWAVAFSIKNYEAKAKALDVARENLDIATKKKAVGKFSPLDVTITESQVALRKVEFNDAELLVESSRDRLLDLLNHAGERSHKGRWEAGEPSEPYDRILVIPTTEADSNPFVGDRNEALRLAFEKRPDYRQIALQIQNEEIVLDLRENELWPKLDLTAGWEQLGLDDSLEGSFSSLGSGRFYNWSVGIQLEVPLSNRGPRSEVLKSKESLRKSNLLRVQLENSIVLEVDQALRNLKWLHRKVVDLEERVRLQQQILDAERKKLKVGTSISYTVSTIENDLIESQALALKANADYQTARAEYQRVTGILLENHAVQVQD